MKCSWVQHRLVAYLDTELPATNRLKVDTHLSACGNCREALQRFESTRPGPGTPQNHPPEYWAPMHKAVLRELETQPNSPLPRRSAWTMAYAFLFFLVVGWSLFQAVLPGGSP